MVFSISDNCRREQHTLCSIPYRCTCTCHVGANRGHTKHNNPCLIKAEDDEAIFVLRGREKSAPRHVILWLADNIETISEEKARDALDCALAMRRHPNRKVAD